MSQSYLFLRVPITDDASGPGFSAMNGDASQMYAAMKAQVKHDERQRMDAENARREAIGLPRCKLMMGVLWSLGLNCGDWLMRGGNSATEETVGRQGCGGVEEDVIDHRSSGPENFSRFRFSLRDRGDDGMSDI